MDKSPAYQRYSKDYLASVRVQMMTLAEEGAYNRLLEFCWVNGSIPSDPQQVARLVGKGCTIEIAKVCLEMFEPHPTDSDKMIHDRMESERLKQKSNSEARKKASEARWNKESEYTDARGKQAKSRSDANAMQMQCKCNPLHISSSSSTSLQEKDETNVSSKKVKGSRIPKDFYPSPEMIAYARKKLPNIDLESRITEFRNYWTAKTGRDATKMDWNLTFQNRIIQIAEYQGQKNGNGIPDLNTDIDLTRRNHQAEMERRKKELEALGK